MKFGHVETDKIDELDLRLPSDHPDNENILPGTKTNDPKVYVGCAKWGRDEWVGKIYPKGTKSSDYLKNYVNHFNSIELNGTFYQTRKNNILSWGKIPAREFKFCPKFSRRISHIKRLKESEENTEWFFDSVSAFGDTLGLPFLQMPDNFAPKYIERLQEFITSVKSGIPYALELRHTEWFTDDEVSSQLYNFLEKQKVTLVITDTAGRRDCVHQRLTTDRAFVRFIGYDLHPSDYVRMDEWAERIKTWIDKGLKEAYFFLHQENEANTVITADYMVEKLNEVCGLNLARPQFLN